MSKPLRLFIKPPYNAAPAGPWSLVHGYGPEVPEPATGPAIHSHALLQTTGTAQFYAAADGRLSARPPGGGGLDPEEEITVPSAGDPLPATVNLYLHLAPGVRANPAFRTRSLAINEIQGFAYLNVETASLEAGLAELLDQAVLPPGGLTRSQLVELLVRGELDVSVTAGHAVGCGSTEGAPTGGRQLGFTVLTQAGPLDPAHSYDWMRDYVADGQPDLDAFLLLVPKRWPVIGPGIATADALALTATALYPMAVLEELRTAHSLTALQWRQVGDNQKALWRLRLLARVGRATAGATDPPFEFDDVDWRNLFQLEALAEFYANFDDPWAAGAAPRAPGGVRQGAAATAAAAIVTLDGAPDLSTVRVNHDLIYLATDTARPSQTYRILEVTGASSVRLDAAPALAGGSSAWRIDLYQTVNFLDPEGTAATAAGNVVTLDGTVDLTRVWVGKDEIKFELDANPARPSKRYRITDMDVAARTVTIDQPPNLVGPSAWRITLRPVAVLIEPFGGRLRGTNATVVSGSPNKVQLDGLPATSKINPNLDTIYLPGDTARTSRTYRITAVDDATDQVTLDGNPVLGGGSLAWHIPSGVSGELPALTYTLGPNAARGWDHYDGILFVVYQGTVHNKFRWTSFTSHNYAAGHQYRSSLRGNRRYHFASLRSPGSNFINYAFKVYDHDATYDGVREARFYFETACTEDRAAATANPGTNGKTELRFHNGSRNKPTGGTGSAGCLVSPSFYDFRDTMITLYQDGLDDFDGSSDAEVNKCLNVGAAASETLWGTAGAAGLTAANWNGKMVGTLWLIRPDERPL